MKENKFDVFEQFARMEWLLKRYNQQNHKNNGPMSDPHRGQGRILTMLKLQPEISQKELSFLLDIRPQSLGELLSKLERGGYITRTPSETDHRVMDIHLTEKGLEAANPQSDLDKMLDCLTAEEQLNLNDYLNRLITTFESELKPEEKPDEEPDEEPDIFDPLKLGETIRKVFNSDFDLTSFINDKCHFDADFDLRDFMNQFWPGAQDEHDTETQNDTDENTPTEDDPIVEDIPFSEDEPTCDNAKNDVHVENDVENRDANKNSTSEKKEFED
ncbi:MAG: MarR family transcriptional regulator [Eubacterium sp.]